MAFCLAASEIEFGNLKSFSTDLFRNAQEEGQIEVLVGYSELRCGNINDLSPVEFRQ